MWKTAVVTTALMTVLSASASAQDAKTVIDDASKAMGVTGLNSIVYGGAAAQGNFGQSRTISFGLASTSIRNYVRAIDFTRSASRATGDTMPPAVRGGPPPQPGTYDQSIAPDAPWAQQLRIWATPWGFLKGAAANAATVRSRKIDDVQYKVVTWSPAQKAPSGQPYRLVGYIGPDNLVARVETWVEHPVMGDMHDEFFYRDYRDIGGLKVPARTALRQVGMESFVEAISDARANPPNIAEMMTVPSPSTPAGAGAAGGAAAAGRGGPGTGAPGGPAAPTAVASEKLADGVYRITGGYVSMAVEFKDYVVVLEGGQSEARGLAVLAETKRLFPAKRIKYVVNTHPHFDHASGLG